MMLLKLLSACDTTKTNPLVISLMDKGTIGERIEDLGIRVFELNISYKSPLTLNLIKLWFVLRQFKPDIFQGWMYHANFLAYFFSFIFPKTKIFLGIRQTLYDIKNERIFTRFLIYLGKYISHRCDAVIYNSKKSLEQHLGYGYSRNNVMLIPNGFDVSSYSPSKFRNNVNNIKRKLGIPVDAFIIGIVARNHPMKGHSIFLTAAQNLLDKYPDIHFMGIGEDVTYSKLGHLIDNRYKSSIHLLGERQDIPELISILDLSVNSSTWGEAFSNAICETMAMEIPCVVTDIGDSKYIVGEYGFVVEPGDIVSLTSGLTKMVELKPDDRKQLGKKSRARIIESFSLEKITKDYELLYEV